MRETDRGKEKSDVVIIITVGLIDEIGLAFLSFLLFIQFPPTGKPNLSRLFRILGPLCHFHVSPILPLFLFSLQLINPYFLLKNIYIETQYLCKSITHYQQLKEGIALTFLLHRIMQQICTVKLLSLLIRKSNYFKNNSASFFFL